MTAALALVALTSPAAARAQLRVAVIELDLEGQLGPEARDPVVAALASALRPGATHVLSPSDVEERLRGVEGLDDSEAPGFAAAAGRALESEALIRARVDQLEQLYTVEVELLLARDGSRLTSTVLECAACTWDEAIQTVVRAGEGLAAHLPGRLLLEVEPPEATVTVDGEEIPVDGARWLRPGTHRVEARLRGHRRERRQVSIVAGGATSVSLTLAEAEPPGGEPTPIAHRSVHDPLWLGAWLTLGASVAALVPGVLWLVLDGSCPLDWNSEDGTCPEVYDLWPQGLALAAVGAALLSASVTLFAVEAFRRRQSRAVAVLVAPSPLGGGSLQVTGTF